ncbi:MAG: PstS family phosphate ABC transporter substrate-binding protein [Planctomyces sp.]|nr:PstS family phosphate ABC transporter substrate-binding protein [Planctomyces sp.]
MSRPTPRLFFRSVLATGLAVLLLGCPGCTIKTSDPSGSSASGTGGGSAALSGEIVIDGSSTVLPISAAVSEEFNELHPRVRVPVGASGTSSGFKRLIEGTIDIADASRPISQSEQDQLNAKGIEYLELQVALDGLTVAVNKENAWCSALTVNQLRELWNKDSTVKRWKDLDPSWPDAPIKLFGAGTNSGTFDYFTEAVTGTKGNSRSDYTQSEDDNTLVADVVSDKYSLGYFGYSYYEENRDKLKVVSIAPGDDLSAAVEPTRESVENGTYAPLSRPLYLYVARKALDRPEVVQFLNFYLSEEGQALVPQAHCIRLNAEQLRESRAKLAAAAPSALR